MAQKQQAAGIKPVNDKDCIRGAILSISSRMLLRMIRGKCWIETGIPEQVSIRGAYYRHTSDVWDIVLEGELLACVPRGQMLPQVPCTIRCEDGTYIVYSGGVFGGTETRGSG